MTLATSIAVVVLLVSITILNRLFEIAEVQVPYGD